MVRTFDITPASSASIIVIAAIGLIFLLLLGFFAFMGYSIMNTKFEVSDQGLNINGGIYGRFIPKADIASENIKTIDLTTYSEYQPRLRTNGIGLPGYAEGWFRLKNKEKALLFVTDRANVFYIPTNRGYSVLLSISNSDEFRQSVELWR